MREIKNVALSEVIVHILPKEGNPELSELPIPAGSDPRIFQYFERHIRVVALGRRAPGRRSSKTRPKSRPRVVRTSSPAAIWWPDRSSSPAVSTGS